MTPTRSSDDAWSSVNLPMGQRIADVVAEDIASGRYRPGEPLREQDLAARFRASRGPVREAFRILERERLVEVVPWRGARVVRLTISDMISVFELKGAVFPLIARLCAVNGRREELEQIGDALESLSILGDRDGDLEARSASLGERMRAICGNVWAAEMLAQLERQTRWRYARLLKPDEPECERFLSAWQALADALLARDPDTAESIAKRMIREHGERVIAALEREAIELSDKPPKSEPDSQAQTARRRA